MSARMARRITSLAIVAAAVAGSGPALAAPAGGTAGAAIEAAPVCLGKAMEPGHSYQMATDGLTPGAMIANTGSGSEDLVLSVGPQQWQLPGYPVPARWVSFGYPKTLLVIPQHHISLAAGASATVPVTVSVPAGARAGTYVAGLIVSTSGGTGGVQLGAAAETMLAFTVGVPRPDWSAAQIAGAGNCWVPEPKLTPWQQAMGTSYPDPPPGWHRTATSWLYDPPPGWVLSWIGGHLTQVYRGGQPVVQCTDPASYPAPGGGSEIGGSSLPVTSTAAGCAQWLAASKAGTLSSEPVTGGSTQASLAVHQDPGGSDHGQWTAAGIAAGLGTLVLIGSRMRRRRRPG